MPKPSEKASRPALDEQQAAPQRHRVSVTRRIVLANVQPHVENGRYAVRRIVGDAVPVRADVFCEGDATLQACILYRPAGETRWRPAPMQCDDPGGVSDSVTWRGVLRLQHGGRTQFCVEAWLDVFRSWANRLSEAIATDAAPQVDASLLSEGQSILDSALTRASGADLKLLAECRESLGQHAQSPEGLQRWLRNRDMHKRMLVHGERRHVVRSQPALEIEASRRRAAFVTFCRLSGAGERTQQTADTLRQVGAEVVQIPSGPPPSAWPTGVDRAALLPLPSALESTWHEEHPGWFADQRTQDRNRSMTVLDFWCEERDALWQACLASMLQQVKNGVTVFVALQADTVPFPFWEWAIRRTRQIHPEVLFVTGPVSAPRAQALSRVGFSQVLQEWEGRVSQAADAVESLARWNTAEWRPLVEVPVSCPAGLAEELKWVQLLAATSSPCFSIQGLSHDPEAISWLHILNRLRRDNRALQIEGNLALLPTSSEDVLAFHRGAPQGRNDIVVVVNRRLDAVIEAEVHLPELPQPQGDGRIVLEDLLDGQQYTWHPGANYVRLGPALRHAHVFRVVRQSRLFS